MGTGHPPGKKRNEFLLVEKVADEIMRGKSYGRVFILNTCVA